VTLTLTLDRFILHTIMRHSSTSTYIPNFIEIEKKRFVDGRTDIWDPLLLGQLVGVDLKISRQHAAIAALPRRGAVPSSIAGSQFRPARFVASKSLMHPCSCYPLCPPLITVQAAVNRVITSHIIMSTRNDDSAAVKPTRYSHDVRPGVSRVKRLLHTVQLPDTARRHRQLLINARHKSWAKNQE